jgi:hypothetical protein
MATIEVRPIQKQDRSWVEHRTCMQWGGETVVAHGVRYVPAELPGCVALVVGQGRAAEEWHEVTGTGWRQVTGSWVDGTGSRCSWAPLAGRRPCPA